MSKHPKPTVVIGELPPDDTFDAAYLAKETLTGDLRDFILDRLKHEQSKAPWHQRSEADQREAVHQVEAAVRSAVTRAVEIIAGHGRRTIKATIEQLREQVQNIE